MSVNCIWIIIRGGTCTTPYAKIYTFKTLNIAYILPLCKKIHLLKPKIQHIFYRCSAEVKKIHAFLAIFTPSKQLNLLQKEYRVVKSSFKLSAVTF